MANINELGLTNEKLDISYEDIPEEGGGYTPQPQPGRYKFSLPPDLSNVWDTFKAKVPTSNIKETRLTAIFDAAAPLTITWSQSGDGVGEKYVTRISNAERNRGKDKIPVSDMQYLARVLEPDSTPMTHIQFVNLLQRHAGEEFGASIEWSAYCNTEKSIWVADPDSGVITEQEDLVGCGANFYQRDLTKVNGVYAERLTCTCGASLRCWGNLTRFRPASEVG